MVLRSDDRLRAMYAGGHADATARRWARLWVRVTRWGVLPQRWVVLEVRGKRSGVLRRIPVGLADVDDRWYLVSMLGECNWVRNVRAADGEARLLRRDAHDVMLTEVPVAQRPAILKRYVEIAPGGRPHIPVDRHRPVADFAAIADRYPVFRVAARR